MRLLVRGFHTLIKNTSFSSPTNVRSHNHPPPSGPCVLTGTRSLLQSMWDLQSTSLQDPTTLLAHRLVSTPFGAQPPCWHIAWCLTLIPFIAAQTYREQILSSLGFPFQGSFKTRLLRGGFYTLTKNVSFSSPTDVRSHIINLMCLSRRKLEFITHALHPKKKKKSIFLCKGTAVQWV